MAIATLLGGGGIGGAYLSYRVNMRNANAAEKTADVATAKQAADQEAQEGDLAVKLTQAARDWLDHQEQELKALTETNLLLTAQITEAQKAAADALKMALDCQAENKSLMRMVMEQDALIKDQSSELVRLQRTIDEQLIMLEASEKARASLDAARRTAEKDLREIAAIQHEPLPMQEMTDQVKENSRAIQDLQREKKG